MERLTSVGLLAILFTASVILLHADSPAIEHERDPIVIPSPVDAHEPLEDILKVLGEYNETVGELIVDLTHQS